jgi:glycosyltransferase involved in cell wall biosynthesis
LARPPLLKAAIRIAGPFVFEATRFSLASAPGRFGSAPPIVIGYFGGTNGIALVAQLVSRALSHLQIEHRRLDAEDNTVWSTDVLNSRALILCVNPPELVPLLARRDPDWMGGPRYAYWVWELPKAPKAWARAASAIDMVLAPSHFTAASLRSARRPVHVAPYPLIASDFDRISRGVGRRAGERFRAVSLFDLKSSGARKNPLASVLAFKRAFGEDPGARLILKSTNAALAPEIVQSLKAASGSNVEFLDGGWERSRVLELIASADVLISLHRAEGFGLTLAEAMMLGTPTIATGWSGNLEFMTSETACLTPVVKTPIVDRQSIYAAGQDWAEPDVGAAADYLCKLDCDPFFARDMAKRAQVAVRARLSAEAWLDGLPAILKNRLLPQPLERSMMPPDISEWQR